MKRSFILLIVLAFIANLAQAQSNFIDKNYIEVTGKAQKEIVPNEIYLQVFINENDNKGKESLEMLEMKMIKKLQEIGVDMKKEFTVKDMSSNFKNYWLRKSDIFTSKQYQIIVHTAPVAGRVFRELEALGISNINMEKLDHSEIEKFKKEIKADAVRDARETAEALASAANRKVGRAIYIRENEPFFYRTMVAAESMMKVRGAAIDANYTEPDIEFEKIKLEYSVQVFFELDDQLLKIDVK